MRSCGCRGEARRARRAHHLPPRRCRANVVQPVDRWCGQGSFGPRARRIRRVDGPRGRSRRNPSADAQSQQGPGRLGPALAGGPQALSCCNRRVAPRERREGGHGRGIGSGGSGRARSRCGDARGCSALRSGRDRDGHVPGRAHVRRRAGHRRWPLRRTRGGGAVWATPGHRPGPRAPQDGDPAAVRWAHDQLGAAGGAAERHRRVDNVCPR